MQRGKHVTSFLSRAYGTRNHIYHLHFIIFGAIEQWV